MKIIKFFLLSMVLIGLVSMAAYNFTQRHEGEKEGFLSVAVSTPAIEYWREYFPENEIIKWDQEDLTNNGRKDTAIIFNVGYRQNALVVVLDEPDGYVLTEQIPAPVENQVIDFVDFDNQPPIDLFISGSKGPHVGYAIYRVVGRELVDLFAMDMTLCC